MDLSPTGKGRVYLWTALGTLGCIAVALLVDSFNFHNLDAQALRWSIAIDILLPIGLAAPILYFLLSKLRELAIAHELLRRHAATDTLTDLLNRGAFTREVEEALDDARFSEDGMRGTLLVIDADNFKAINDTFGHEQGDAALRRIAGAIRSVLRSADLVGRIGGEEFAVYLPGTTQLIAEAVAERLRLAVYEAEFAPDGKTFDFKKNWGFEPAPLYYEYFLVGDKSVPEINPLNPKYRLFIQAWKKMPLALANVIGPHIVKNLG